MVNFCCVAECKNEYYPGCGFSFHRFPRDESMREKWSKVVPGKIVKTSLVCSKKFEVQDYDSTSRKILKSHARPFFQRSMAVTDFKDGQITNKPIIEIKEKPVCLRKRHPNLKNLHTLTDWKGEPTPFSFFLKPKDIVRTNPSDVQETYVKPVDIERDEVQRTRPRLVMTPAVSVDDINDPETRRILVEDMYTSNTGKASKEALSEYFSVRAPFPGRPAPANPIFLPTLKPPSVPPCWRMESVKWDRDQLRAYCDPNAEFWKRAGSVYKCETCKDSRNIESHKKMIKKIKNLN